jgi:hypothetical protein
MTSRGRTLAIRLAAPLLAVVAVMAGGTAAAAAPTPAPPAVQGALQAFDAAPEAAMTAWVDWAKGQTMTYTSTAVDGKYACRVDASGVSTCTIWNPKVPGHGWVFHETFYTLANHRTQVFKYRGAWVYNSYGADNNAFTNTSRFYPYDYWLPWQTPGVPVTTSTDAAGWHVVTSQNVNPGDDQSEVTVVKVSPDGSRAVFLQQNTAGKVAQRTTITLRDVRPITVPKAKKQVL